MSTIEQMDPIDNQYHSVVATGGTGFLGLQMCQYFADQGQDVIGINLKPFNEEDDTEDIEYIEEDVRNKVAVYEAIEAADADMTAHSAAAIRTLEIFRIF